jgi:predicted nucleic acid-binding protein
VAGALTADEAEDARAVFASLPVHREDVTEIADEAWRVAEELGLAKTYDAEFLALARLRGAPLVTADVSCAAAQTGSGSSWIRLSWRNWLSLS